MPALQICCWNTRLSLSLSLFVRARTRKRVWLSLVIVEEALYEIITRCNTIACIWWHNGRDIKLNSLIRQRKVLLTLVLVSKDLIIDQGLKKKKLQSNWGSIDHMVGHFFLIL